jgi:hypothetical protein
MRYYLPSDFAAMQRRFSMISTLPLIRRFAACAGIASFGLWVAPAWSACTATPLSDHVHHPFHADDGVVSAPATGLTWQRCSLGQKFNDGNCHGSASKVDWADAQKAATVAGHGWRLPTQTELVSLLLSNCTAPATDNAAFPGTPATWYWSSTADGPQGAWFVDFEKGGGAGATLRASVAAVRLVRTGSDR